jgi:hypothetical protein
VSQLVGVSWDFRGTGCYGRPVTRGWTQVDNDEQQAIIDDLRAIIAAGIWHFKLTRLTTLPGLFSDGSGAAAPSTIRDRVLALLMFEDPGKHHDEDPDSLSASTNFRLTLFRATRNSKYLNADQAREDASAFIGKRLTSDGVRREHGPEWHLVTQLCDAVVDSLRPLHVPRATSNSSAAGLAASGEDGYAPISAPALGPTKSPVAQDFYRRLTASDVEEGLWWRLSTKDYIDQLAELEIVTVYVGADGPSDVGLPRHSNLFQGLVRSKLAETHQSTDESTERVITAIAAHVPATHVGSILRELYRPRPRARELSVNAETRLHFDVQTEISHARSGGGFIARSIALLAFTLRAHQRSAEVITGHYDDDIINAERNRHEYFPSLRSISFRDYFDKLPEDEPGAGVVPLLRIHGRPGDPSSQSMVVGEADFLADEHVSADGHGSDHASRYRVLTRALTRGAVVFVGTSLTDPGVLATLAATRHLHKRRYALLLPPEGLIAARLTHDEWALAVHLLSARYLHLGVVPIFADFERQIPQLLREVTLKVVEGDNYVGYGHRLQTWWSRWAPLLGYDFAGDRRDGPDQKLVARWRARLDGLCATIAGLRDLHNGSEEIRIEVWLRNHHKRSLFLWAASTGAGSDSASDEVRVIDDGEDDVVQRALRTGQSIHQPVTQGPWRYCIATNLVLYEHPWNRLAVGIVCVASNRADGTLSEIAADEDGLREFEYDIIQPVKELLRYYDGRSPGTASP